MEDKLVSLETAKLAKKKEFNEICQYYYEILDKPITLQKMSCSNAEGYKQPTAPTQSLLQKWLREKYDIEINITRMPPEVIKSSFNKGNKRIKKYNMWVWSLNGNPRIENPSLFFDNYEEAFEIGLQEALKLIK